jgi:hypothetical protein
MSYSQNQNELQDNELTENIIGYLQAILAIFDQPHIRDGPDEP